MRGISRMYGYGSGSSSYSNSNRYVSRYSKTGRSFRESGNNKVQKVANQFIASCIIALLVIVISNFNVPLVNKVLDEVKWAVGENYNFKENMDQAANSVMPEISRKVKDVYSMVMSIFRKDNPNDIPAANISVMIMPVEGEITSRFSISEDSTGVPKTGHCGIDIACEKGTPIMSALDGVVVQVDQNTSMGRFVRVKHDDGIETVYGHCSEILVKENQQIAQGDYIAKAGDTGPESGEHLHFEVIKDGEQINPEDLINNMAEHM